MLAVARPIRNGVAPISRAYLGMSGTTSWMKAKKSMVTMLSRQMAETMSITRDHVLWGKRVFGIVFDRGI
jgi:hypothetical protein